MYIRNGQSISKAGAGIENFPRAPVVPDISEIKPVKKTASGESRVSADKPAESANFPASPDPNVNNPELEGFEKSANFSNSDIIIADKPGRKLKRRLKGERIKKPRNKKYGAAAFADAKPGRIAEYLYNRKYYILLFSVVYIAGLIIGAILVKNIEETKIAGLRNAVDNYFTDPNPDIPLRVINSVAADGALLFIAYLSGVTVFAPFICAAICLYKGLSCGYIIGAYISGGTDLFHIAVCFLSFIFYLLTMLCFLLLCAESMGFSVFLMKSGESFRKNLSLRNIAVYSARYALLLVLTAAVAALQTIALPLVYSAYY